ncbi:MAG: peptidylprolyl isomerase [Candidatus Fermentibacteraceae bacterium]
MKRRLVLCATAVSMALLLAAAGCGGGEEPEAGGEAERTEAETAEQEQTVTTQQPEQEPEMIKASHILIAYQGAARAAATRSQGEARQLAEELSGLIEGDSLTFEDAAIEYSDCPSGAQGGDLGSFGRGSMVPAFEEAAFSLEPGEVSGIVETDFGYHLIKRTE